MIAWVGSHDTTNDATNSPVQTESEIERPFRFPHARQDVQPMGREPALAEARKISHRIGFTQRGGMSLMTCSAGSLPGSDFRLIDRSLAVTMNQETSLPQLSRSVS
jgi:hypothetical protein